MMGVSVMAVEVDFKELCFVCGNLSFIVLDGLGLCHEHYSKAMNQSRYLHIDGGMNLEVEPDN